jgi:ElaB/YqjD/DUF883 family membrane-anchored ribosome-binding protein
MPKVNLPSVEPLSVFEEPEKVEIRKVESLDHLGSVAAINTKKIHALRRIQTELQESLRGELDPVSRQDVTNHLTKVTTAVNQRLARSGELIRRRTTLQNKKADEAREQLQELLRPTRGTLNIAKQNLLTQLTHLHEEVKRSRSEANRHEQRRLAARLYQWESNLLNALMLIDKLPPLPEEAE